MARVSARAKPKSHSLSAAFDRDSGSTRRFSGLMSRWTMSGAVAPRDGADELPDVTAHRLGVEAVRALLQHLEKVTLDVLEHQVELALATESLLRREGREGR